MSAWTHNICTSCWREQHGDRARVVLAAPEIATCCWCGKANSDGIYPRAAPAETPCKGKHEGADS